MEHARTLQMLDLVLGITQFSSFQDDAYTVDSPDKISRKQNDYRTINKRFRNFIKSVKTYPGADVPTYHKLLLGPIGLRFTR